MVSKGASSTSPSVSASISEKMQRMKAVGAWRPSHVRARIDRLVCPGWMRQQIGNRCRQLSSGGAGEYARVRSRLTGSPVRRSTASLNFATAPQIPQINNLVRPIHWPSQHTPAAPRFFFAGDACAAAEIQLSLERGFGTDILIP